MESEWAVIPYIGRTILHDKFDKEYRSTYFDIAIVNFRSVIYDKTVGRKFFRFYWKSLQVEGIDYYFYPRLYKSDCTNFGYNYDILDGILRMAQNWIVQIS